MSGCDTSVWMKSGKWRATPPAPEYRIGEERPEDVYELALLLRGEFGQAERGNDVLYDVAPETCRRVIADNDVMEDDDVAEEIYRACSPDKLAELCDIVIGRNHVIYDEDTDESLNPGTLQRAEMP